METKNTEVSPASNNPNNPLPNDAPPDPSNTSYIGQKVEQGVISKKEGISEQSSEWEDNQERGIAKESLIDDKAEKYIKNPSPEEVNHNEDEN